MNNRASYLNEQIIKRYIMYMKIRKLLFLVLAAMPWVMSIAQGVKVVEVKKAGMLAELLTDDEKANTEELTIKGKLNSSDVVILRRMAGATDHDEFTWIGRLRKLDISKADFVDDETPFFSFKPGDNYKVTIRRDHVRVRNRNTGEIILRDRDQYLRDKEDYRNRNSQSMLRNTPATRKYNRVEEGNSKEEFVLSKLTDKEWSMMQRQGWDKREDSDIIRQDDGTFMIACHTGKNIISSCMFYNCSTLETVILNHHTEQIRYRAFYGCKKLRGISIPKSVEYLASSAFGNAPCLEKVLISNNPSCTLLKLDDNTIKQQFFRRSANLEIVRY